MIRFAAICVLLVPSMAAAFDASLPEGAEPLAAEIVEDGAYRLPTGVFDGSAVPLETVEGRVTRRSWRIPGLSDKTAAIARSIEEQLVAQGYEIVLNCISQRCGGFDFRFAVEVLPPPSMFVDLADYHFISAQRTDGDEAVGIMISQTVLAAMVQIMRVSPGAGAPLTLAPAPAPGEAPQVGHVTGSGAGTLAQALEARGAAVLAGLTFKTGASELGEGPFETLEALAAWLLADETRRVVLVGHTDSEGDLDRNIALSQERAQAVLEALSNDYGVNAEQMSARGIGFLAPRKSNATEEGRKANRRVEVVVRP